MLFHNSLGSREGRINAKMFNSAKFCLRFSKLWSLLLGGLHFVLCILYFFVRFFQKFCRYFSRLNNFSRLSYGCSFKSLFCDMGLVYFLRTYITWFLVVFFFIGDQNATCLFLNWHLYKPFLCLFSLIRLNMPYMSLLWNMHSFA